jgi:hypothetical protein
MYLYSIKVILIALILAGCAPLTPQDLFNYNMELKVTSPEDYSMPMQFVATFKKDSLAIRGVKVPEDYQVFVDEYPLQFNARLNAYLGQAERNGFAEKSHTCKVVRNTGTRIYEFPFTFKFLNLKTDFPTVLEDKDLKIGVSGLAEGDTVNLLFTGDSIPPEFFHCTVKNDSILVPASDISRLKSGKQTVWISWSFSQTFFDNKRYIGKVRLNSVLKPEDVEVR